MSLSSVLRPPRKKKHEKTRVEVIPYLLSSIL